MAGVLPLICTAVVLWFIAGVLTMIAEEEGAGTGLMISSFLTIGAMEGDGEAAALDKLRARSNWLIGGILEEDVCMPDRIPRAPFCGDCAPLLITRAGASAGLALLPTRRVNLGVGSEGAGILILIF